MTSQPIPPEVLAAGARALWAARNRSRPAGPDCAEPDQIDVAMARAMLEATLPLMENAHRRIAGAALAKLQRQTADLANASDRLRQVKELLEADPPGDWQYET